MQQQNQHNVAYRPRRLIQFISKSGSSRLPWALVVVLLFLLLWQPVIEPALSAFTAPWRLASELVDRQQSTAVSSPAQQLENGPRNGANERPSAQVDSHHLNSTQVLLNGQPVGIVNPQTHIGHPSFYLETGVTGSQRWTVSVPQDAVLIVGGMVVDGQSGGVYKALPGGTTHEVAVNNGFILVTTQEWGHEEFCFRLGQAKEYGWAHQTVMPLSSWQPCQVNETTVTMQSTQPMLTSQANPVTRERVPTGVGQSRSFQAGDTVWGWRISLNNGQTYQSCVLRNAPEAGTLTDGVINPTEQEIASATPCR